MKLENLSDIREEIRPAFDLLRYQREYRGTLLGDYITAFLERKRTPEEEKAMHYGVQAIIKTMKDPRKTSIDEIVDVNRSLQLLKMWRKGHQNDLRKKEEAWAKEEKELRAEESLIRTQWQELQEKRQDILREEEEAQDPRIARWKESFDRKDDIHSSSDPQMRVFARQKDVYRKLRTGFPIVCFLIAVFLIPYPWRMLMLLPGLIGEFWILAASRRVENEVEVYQDKMEQKNLKLEDVLRRRGEVDDELRLQQLYMKKLRVRYHSFLEKTRERQPEDVEIDALNLAIDVICHLSGVQSGE